MKLFVRLTLILAFVAGLASAALALTYGVTKPEIKKAEAKEEQEALKSVFFSGFEKIDPKEAQAGGTTIKYYEVFTKDSGDKPAYYAITGAGIGYNKSSPIELLVGFANPQLKGVKMPDGQTFSKDGYVCAGWKVIKSAETPGLGENAKNTQPSFTWLGKVTGQKDDNSPDRRTAFQKQFEGKTPEEMKAKESIDIITGATYSTVGIIDAVKDAEKKLKSALQAK